MEFLRAILSSKLTTWLGLISAIIGLLTNPEFSGVVPADWSAMLATIGAIVASVSRGLVDADGDGVPDAFQRRG